MRREACAGSRLDSEPAHERLSAMVAGANRDARIVQYGGGVVRMNPVDIEADDSGAVFWPVDCDARNGAKRIAGLCNQCAFMRMDRVERQLFDPVDCRVKADRPDDMRRPC